jgi:hypothetical protein
MLNKKKMGLLLAMAASMSLVAAPSVSAAGTLVSQRPVSKIAAPLANSNWAIGTQYKVGDIVTYQGKTYTCRQANNAIQGWEPSAVPALWQESGTTTPTTPTTTPAASPGKWGSHEFIPYADVMLWPTFSINDAFAKTGQKYFTLAFITSDTSGNPAWGGVTPMDKDFYKDEINNIRSKGGDVTVSFGGSSGTELALSNTDVTTLQAKYQSVIDRYKLNWIDLDIEGSAVADKASVDRRNKAIKGLQQKNPDLVVAYCLPVLPSGLTEDGLNILRNAKANGVRVDVVNIMAMDYGGSMSDGKHMGDDAIKAATAAHNQCTSLGLDTKIGVTPMIGTNDTPGEVFTQADAKKLLEWAKANSWVKALSMWSITRDNQKDGALYQSTKIPQTDFEFTKIFEGFNQP